MALSILSSTSLRGSYLWQGATLAILMVKIYAGETECSTDNLRFIRQNFGLFWNLDMYMEATVSFLPKPWFTFCLFGDSTHLISSLLSAIKQTPKVTSGYYNCHVGARVVLYPDQGKGGTWPGYGVTLILHEVNNLSLCELNISVHVTVASVSNAYLTCHAWMCLMHNVWEFSAHFYSSYLYPFFMGESDSHK